MDIYFRESDFSKVESRIFVTDKYKPGRLFVKTDNVLDSDPETWNLIAKAYNSCNNQKYYYQYFKVIIVTPGPKCNEVKLLPPSWQSTALSQSLFTLGQFLFNPASADLPECGSFNYRVVYGSGQNE